MNILDRVKLLCSDNGISVGDLEKLLELSNGSIYKWNKTTPGSDRVEKVADHFGVSTDYLIGTVPFRNKDEEITSISIASVKYVMNNRSDFDPVFTRSTMDYYFDLLYDSNYRLYKYIDRLVTMYENKDNRISNLEYFELANILFKDIKYNKNYDGLVYLTDFNEEGGMVKLNLNEIPKFTKYSIKFDNSLFYRTMDSKEDDYITHTSLFNVVNINNQNIVEINESKQNFSNEALKVAKAYDSANTDKKTIVKLTLGLSNTYNDNSHLLPNAAHEIEGASEEDKVHDDAIMDDDDF